MMTTMPFLKPVKRKKFDPHASAYEGKDSREGRLHDLKTDRGTFRFKDDRKES